MLGASQLTLLLSGLSRVFSIEAGATISGFTIQNGRSNGGSGIWVNVEVAYAEADPVNIQNNIIKNNVAVTQVVDDFRWQRH